MVDLQIEPIDLRKKNFVFLSYLNGATKPFYQILEDVTFREAYAYLRKLNNDANCGSHYTWFPWTLVEATRIEKQKICKLCNEFIENPKYDDPNFCNSCNYTFKKNNMKIIL